MICLVESDLLESIYKIKHIKPITYKLLPVT